MGHQVLRVVRVRAPIQVRAAPEAGAAETVVKAPFGNAAGAMIAGWMASVAAPLASATAAAVTVNCRRNDSGCLVTWLTAKTPRW